MGDQVYYYSVPSENGFGIRVPGYSGQHIHLHKCGEAATWGGEFKKFIHLLTQLRDLKELTLVLPDDWAFQSLTIEACFCCADVWKDRAIEVDTDIIWRTLVEFIRARPLVNITAVQPVCLQAELDHDGCRHKQHLKNLRYKLGIWDHRVAWIPECGDWHVEGRMEEDPEIYMEYLRILFLGEG